MNGADTPQSEEDQTSDTTSGMALAGEAYSNYKLPEEILGLIFQKIDNLESQLNCRLICKYWKSTFDNPRIMRKLTFVVNDWRLFNESTIVEKVKSITFTAPFLVSEEERKNEWLQFCTRVGSSVERIKFGFDYDNNDDTQQAQLINSLVSSCAKLKELDINQQILECLQQPKYENIQVLVLTLLGRQDGALESALTHFPNLVKIDVNYYWIPGAIGILLEYAKTSPGLLKAINLRDPGGRDFNIVNITELFNPAVNQVNFAGEVLQFLFPTLLHLEIEGDVFGQAINDVLPSFSAYFPNMKILELSYLRIVPSDIFVHLSKLEFLEEIEIQGFGEECKWTDDKFILPCESQRQNQGGVPVLVPAIAAFKNLAELTMNNCNNLTDLFVVQGIVLSESLTVLRIFNCDRITEVSVAALQSAGINYSD